MPSSRDYTVVLNYSRRLPQWQPDGVPLFLTWSLHGSMPQDRFPPPGHPARKAFVLMDRFLDQAGNGPAWMRRDGIARIVADAIHLAENLGEFDLHAYVVMPNHAHIFVTPLVPALRLMHSLKGCIAREANKLLGRVGEPFWQQESYDHWVQDSEQFGRIVRYIEENPVRAGLARSPGEYRWSSAYTGMAS